MIRCFAWTPLPGAPFITTVHFTSPPSFRIFASCSSPSSLTVAASRRSISLSIIAVTSSFVSSVCFFSSLALAEFSESPNSGGVKSLDLRIGDGEVPIEGDQVIIPPSQGYRNHKNLSHQTSLTDRDSSRPSLTQHVSPMEKVLSSWNSCFGHR